MMKSLKLKGTKLPMLRSIRKIRLAQSRREIQLRGGFRLADSIKIKSNQIEFDHNAREIIDKHKTKKTLYLLSKSHKVIGKIDDIEEITLGMQTANFIELKKLISQDRHDPIVENLCLSIVFKDHIKTIDLIAPSQMVCEKWHSNLSKLIEDNQYRNIKHNFEEFLVEQFRSADLDQSGAITFDEILKMLRRLNIVFDEHEVKVLFEKANFRKSGHYNVAEALDIDEFIEFYHLISYTKVLEREFKRLTVNRSSFLSKEELKDFVKTSQKVDLRQAEQFSHDLIAKYEPLEANKNVSEETSHILSSKGFRNMVLSPEFDIVHTHVRTVHQDMNKSMVDYYIATSHNTYLFEDQLEGRSTTETYRIYLSQGCRSVELDISDGDEQSDFEPVVFHKRTLTSKVKLSDIVEIIAKYAFKTSPYPVIISLENNCQNLESLREAADIFKRGFGDYLISAPLVDGEASLPSPEDLKEKIIIKGKRLPASEDSNIEELENKYKLAKELSDLVWYGKSRKLNSLLDCDWNYNEMTSIEEGNSKDYSKKELLNYRRFTSQYLAKVYPHGLRFFSSNYNPIPHWNSGAQMISLNYQTNSNPMWLNKALFETNGSCGYVLKPQHIIDPHFQYPTRRCILHITLLCAFNLPIVDNEIIDPYTEIRIFGTRKYKRRKFSTRAVRNNGLNPQWNKKFKFYIPSKEASLTFIRFRVLNRNFFTNDSIIGLRMIAFGAMAEGYRNINLHDENNKPIEQAKLVVNIKKFWI